MMGFGVYRVSKWLFAIALGGFSVASTQAQNCPDRPNSGTVVADPFSISSMNGALNARFSLGHSVDAGGYTHYCYKYQAGNQVIEAPTLRVNPGDTLNLNVVNGVTDGDSTKMNMAPSAGPICGDHGTPTISSTKSPGSAFSDSRALLGLPSRGGTPSLAAGRLR